MSVKSEPAKTAGPQECAGCGKKIADRYLLKALDLYWHEDCLKCGCCDCRLGEVGSTLYTKGNLILCKRDYLRYYTQSKSERGSFFLQFIGATKQFKCFRVIYQYL